MKRYTPSLYRLPGEPYLYESKDGDYVLAEDVIDTLGSLLIEVKDLREGLDKANKCLSAIIYSVS